MDLKINESFIFSKFNSRILSYFIIDNVLKLNFEKQKIQWFFNPNFLVLNANAHQLGWILAFPKNKI